MKVYLASRYSRIDELNEYKAKLEEMGEIVTSRWLNGEHQLHGGEQARLVEHVPLDEVPDIGALFAQDDVEDVTAADVVISFSEKPGSEHSRGGRHVEFGLALALGKRLVLIGPRENVFHCLPCISVFSSFTEFLNENAK